MTTKVKTVRVLNRLVSANIPSREQIDIIFFQITLTVIRLFNEGCMRGKSLLVIVIMLSLIGCASTGRPTPEQLANNTFAEFPNNYQQMIHERLKATLIDPYSAMFRFSTPEKYVYSGQFGHFIVVGVNAKNRYGGAYRGE